MRHPLTEAQEDYLKAILLLEEKGGRATTQALAGFLGVRPASVTEMLKKLAELGLVRHTLYRGAELTPLGRQVALEVVRHHRLLETFLHQALGYGWEEVHAEAERLEHHISEAFERRIAELLGHPERDPHGDPIPGPGLELEPEEGLGLLEAPLGRARLLRVLAQDPDTLTLLAQLGLRPGRELELLERSSEGVRLRVGRKTYLLPTALAGALRVQSAVEPPSTGSTAPVT
ncbi:metal-dependent transcriptional regulator [Thermus filiformis]|uniref:Manganese transport regulator n=1 Tax=Thermus filiformis TaxID=276 RepID=A0A0A2WQM6_THEFI|nr:metal-dependent transcriptional regulator [Thermus filiformis]KGQ22476.2 DtxR family transcriptional regulator [Thermus filiformis]